jgi:hypothetical protein
MPCRTNGAAHNGDGDPPGQACATRSSQSLRVTFFVPRSFTYERACGRIHYADGRSPETLSHYSDPDGRSIGRCRVVQPAGETDFLDPDRWPAAGRPGRRAARHADFPVRAHASASICQRCFAFEIFTRRAPLEGAGIRCWSRTWRTGGVRGRGNSASMPMMPSCS